MYRESGSLRSELRRKEGATETADRRQTVCYPVNADTTCPLLSPVVEEFGTIRIKDVSMAGIGLMLSRRVEVGALLAVTLANASRGLNKTVLVRIAHVTAVSGGFHVGGTFTVPLTYQEMSNLVM